MNKFYDELLDTNIPNDVDVDIIYPDGSKDEMYLPKLPKIGEMLRGYVIEKIIMMEVKTENDCEARIELKRKED